MKDIQKKVDVIKVDKGVFEVVCQQRVGLKFPLNVFTDKEILPNFNIHIECPNNPGLVKLIVIDVMRMLNIAIPSKRFKPSNYDAQGLWMEDHTKLELMIGDLYNYFVNIVYWEERTNLRQFLLP